MGKVQISITALVTLMTAMSFLVMFPLWKPTTPAWWIVKALPTMFSPVVLVIALLTLGYGLKVSSPTIVVLSTWLVAFFTVHLVRLALPPEENAGFARAFGDDWKEQYQRTKVPSMLKTRFGLGDPGQPAPVCKKDIPYYDAPGIERKLLCDIWEPLAIDKSGLAIVYVHGSAWYMWDKDAGTRKFFRHLTGQGHVVMDIAYRLYPETDMAGMVHDVKRAVVWIKENANTLGIDPQRVILCGGSAGGHLSLLAAYTASDSLLTPSELTGKDIRVAGVIAMYGPTDLTDLYYHTGQNVSYERFQRNPKPATEMPKWIQSLIGQSNYTRLGLYKNPDQTFLPDILGGTPDQIPDTYKRFSPISYVQEGCPPTLLLQGTHDLITSVHSTRVFHARLKEAGVPVVMHLFPQIDHGYDLVMPGFSLAVHNSWYDIDRFLSILDANPVAENRAKAGVVSAGR